MERRDRKGDRVGEGRPVVGSRGEWDYHSGGARFGNGGGGGDAGSLGSGRAGSRRAGSNGSDEMVVTLSGERQAVGVREFELAVGGEARR